MRTTIAAIVLAASLAACGRTAGPGDGGDQNLTFQQLVESPQDYDGSSVRFETGYLSGFEISVLTSGFAESYPPQATRPSIWVEAPAPDGECIETAQGTVWSEHVVAQGTFRYDADTGFGHLGAYDMTLEDAMLTCG
jgi:hypothetical protein